MTVAENEEEIQLLKQRLDDVELILETLTQNDPINIVE
jgi:hypothetical protein|tara:strand:+ start:1068 stop:1181 length:114 start_codon:yes stop_codon:yes gene_type:complete